VSKSDGADPFIRALGAMRVFAAATSASTAAAHRAEPAQYEQPQRPMVGDKADLITVLSDLHRRFERIIAASKTQYQAIPIACDSRRLAFAEATTFLAQQFDELAAIIDALTGLWRDYVAKLDAADTAAWQSLNAGCAQRLRRELTRLAAWSTALHGVTLPPDGQALSVAALRTPDGIWRFAGDICDALASGIASLDRAETKIELSVTIDVSAELKAFQAEMTRYTVAFVTR
jgi:hypothetical protein